VGLPIPHLIAETVLLAITRRDRLSAADRRDLFGELGRAHRLLRVW
jgi:hypothetical protein